MATVPLLWLGLSFCLGVDYGHNWGVEKRPGLLEMPPQGQESSPRRVIQVPPVKAQRTLEWTTHRERRWGGGGDAERRDDDVRKGHCDHCSGWSTASEQTPAYNARFEQQTPENQGIPGYPLGTCPGLRCEGREAAHPHIPLGHPPCALGIGSSSSGHCVGAGSSGTMTMGQTSVNRPLHLVAS